MYKWPLNIKCNLYRYHEFHIQFWTTDWAFSKKAKCTNNKRAVIWQLAHDEGEHRGMYSITAPWLNNHSNGLLAHIAHWEFGSVELPLSWIHRARSGRGSEVFPCQPVLLPDAAHEVSYGNNCDFTWGFFFEYFTMTAYKPKMWIFSVEDFPRF